MTLNDFKSSTNDPAPPDVNDYLLALWFDAKDNWNKAHETAQDINDVYGAWIHAYLHRKEGDSSNASYWYSRAGKSFSKLSLEDEWNEITSAMLKL